MANLSDFFPGTAAAASSGTNIITDIKDMQMWMFPSSQLTYYSNSTEYSSGNDNFFTAINGTDDTDARTLKLSAGFSTYETLTNITGAGYLHWVIFPGNIASSGWAQVRITIDGVATEIRTNSFPDDPYVPDRGRAVLGAIMPVRSTYEGQTNLSAEKQLSTSMGSWGPNGQFNRVTFGNDGTSPDFIARTSNWGDSWGSLPTIQTSQNLLPKLKFNTSLKIEAQVNWNSTINYNGTNYCATYFTLIA